MLLVHRSLEDDPKFFQSVSGVVVFQSPRVELWKKTYYVNLHIIYIYMKSIFSRPRTTPGYKIVVTYTFLVEEEGAAPLNNGNIFSSKISTLK